MSRESQRARRRSCGFASSCSYSEPSRLRAPFRKHWSGALVESPLVSLGFVPIGGNVSADGTLETLPGLDHMLIEASLVTLIAKLASRRIEERIPLGQPLR